MSIKHSFGIWLRLGGGGGILLKGCVGLTELTQLLPGIRGLELPCVMIFIVWVYLLDHSGISEEGS